MSPRLLRAKIHSLLLCRRMGRKECLLDSWELLCCSESFGVSVGSYKRKRERKDWRAHKYLVVEAVVAMI